MILTGAEIKKRLGKDIVITPYDQSLVGPASIDVRLGNIIMMYKEHYLDAKEYNETTEFILTDGGHTLQPNIIYLATTYEYTETHNLVPVLEGKSSIGRLGISIHITAGYGDPGFCGHWTLEITCVKPVRVYPMMPIGQIVYHSILGEVEEPYNKREQSKYNNKSAIPMASKMHLNFKP
jgi:dCTP deaminase